MQVITVSPKYQVVIPSALRKAMDIRPGTKLQAIRYGSRVELIPVRDISAARGSLEGIDTHIEREADRL